MHSAALLLLPLLPLAAAESVVVTVSQGITTTFTLPAWLYPPSGTPSSTVTVTPTATLVVIPSTTTFIGETTTTVYVGSSTMSMAAGTTASPSPTATTQTFNSAVSSYLSSIMSVETAGSGSGSNTSTATTSSTSTATATTTVIAGLSPSRHCLF
jgi:hypothetical protein